MFFQALPTSRKAGKAAETALEFFFTGVILLISDDIHF
jgi:hypothetical protein